MDAQHAENLVAPVEKTLQVPLSVEAAFNLFTRDLTTWWPLASHSVGLAEAKTCHVEEHEGGRVYEIQEDGTEAPWGTVLAWQPPHRFMMSWHPGRDATKAQELEVRFEAEGEGTRLELIHRGWELLGEAAQETRDSYVSGWDIVLGHYVTQMKAVAADS